MRISDWSSDVCSSDLPMGASRAVEGEKLRSAREMDLARTIEAIDSVESAKVHLAVEPPSVFLRERSKPSASSSEERRVGKEVVSTCSSRLLPDNSKKQSIKKI